MRTIRAAVLPVLLLAATGAPASAEPPVDRTVLPVPEPRRPAIRELDARNATPPPRFAVKAPKGAPNVVVILVDDMGFGQPSTFGGGVAMPTLDRLAAGGLRFNNMHVAALCSPTRAALLTGRNHHTSNTGAVMDVATAFPGNTGVCPRDVAPLAEMLRLNGYNTAAFGKWHLAPLWELSVSGPMDRWPTGSGFEKFYGFLGGEMNHWAPYLFDGTTRVEVPSDPSYNLTTDLSDRASAWVRFQHSLTPDKPFFLYFAPGATHAPHHVAKEWADKYKGAFDDGWDKYRERTLARQIELGVVPKGTKLAPKPAAIRDWDTLSPDEKRVFARQMEVFAGFGEQCDHEIGRFVRTLEELGVLDDTLLLYIAGDNGASAEGGMTGVFNESLPFNGVPATLEDQVKHLDAWGGPATYPHFAVGWAVAGNTPFAYAKQVASDYGGTKNGMVVHWPKGLKAKGEVRTQWHHVVDVAPAVLEAAGLPFPRVVNGTEQRPFEGVSFLYALHDAAAKDRHTTQYFEIAGNRAIYHEGWLARTIHRAPWEPGPRAPLAQDVWQLYDTRDDFSLANDLAAREPRRLEELKALFLAEALKYDVLPIDDRTYERLNPSMAGRPDLMGGRTSITLYEGMTGMFENAFLNVKNRSSSIRADLEVPGGARGVVLAQGGRFGGWSLYLDGGRPTYVYNFVGLERTVVAAPEALAAGPHEVSVDFAYEGGGPGKGATVTVLVDGKQVAQGRVARTTPNVFSGDEGADVGIDEDTPVAEAYQAGAPSRFTGRIRKIVLEVR